MELYIKVSFWMWVVWLIVKIFIMSASEYPRVIKVKLQTDVVELVLCIAFLFWAGALVWGK